MAAGQFSVLLDKREGRKYRHKYQGFVVEGVATLRGMPIPKKGSTCVADSMEAILTNGLRPVPTYRLIGGRAFARRNDAVWDGVYDSFAERITAYDKDGILGKKEETYVVDIQNGGIFVLDHPRIREAVNNEALEASYRMIHEMTKEITASTIFPDGTIGLDQKEIDDLLNAIKGKNFEALRQIVHGQNIVFSGNYQEFLEASRAPDFIDGMSSTYVVVRPVAEARGVPSGHFPILLEGKLHPALLQNPDLIIASGGETPNRRMLERVEKFGWSGFDSSHDGYPENGGRVIHLTKLCLLVSNYYSQNRACFVGAAPDTLDRFYKGKST